MLRIDKSIYDTNLAICENISYFKKIDRGLLSQNILGYLRNFIEYIVIKEFSQGDDVNPNDYDFRVAALKYIKSRGNLRFLYKFHDLLQKSVSHYTVDGDGSERLMLKYYEYLLKVKKFLKEKYNMNVLENINEFPLNIDTELNEYYSKIAKKINKPSKSSRRVMYDDRYYIQKIKPFFIDENIYYEVTFTMAYANTSKFDRVIAFTKQEIVDNYAVKLSIHSDEIDMLDKKMSILVIDSYEVAIRPCELDNFSELFGDRFRHNITSNEYKKLMEFISNTKMSLTELISSDIDYYSFVRNQITMGSKSTKIFQLLDKSREIIMSSKPGSNTLRYLLYKMNNRIIKLQTNNEPCERMSGLYLKYGCIPFEEMPYCTSLIQHNPKIVDLLQVIPIDSRDCEIFARYIKNNTEIEGKLFTPIDEIEGFENIENLIEEYNKSLYYKHRNNRRLEIYNNYIFINGYVKDSVEIIKRLQDLSSSGVRQYTTSVDYWLSTEFHGIDDMHKKEAMRMMFSESRVAFIYGSAGTGKSTLIKHISDFWATKSKLFLANTHPAVGNMRRKVTAGNSEFKTIASFLSNRNQNVECDVLFIDECSTVSNSDMKQVLDKASFELLVLVGDVYQIESIYFGNWFSIARKFVPQTSVFELEHPYRTRNNDLILIWDRVRHLDDAILEPLVKNNYVARLDDSIFKFRNDDEIILCLNYDGLYGINNINRFIQSTNPSPEIIWGINIYKVGDPILFNESNLFSPLIHNNTKGKIVSISTDDLQILFEIELEKSINEMDARGYSFDLIGVSETSGNSIISFSINKYKSTDEDDYYDSTVIPFQIAYAVSIHKAQGLEYDSVKIVITNEVEEKVTHNIFYTAITRAKNKLKIYWSPETGQSVIKRFEEKNWNRDSIILSNYASLQMIGE